METWRQSIVSSPSYSATAWRRALSSSSDQNLLDGVEGGVWGADIATKNAGSKSIPLKDPYEIERSKEMIRFWAAYVQAIVENCLSKHLD